MTGREPGHRTLLTSYVGGESLETTVNVQRTADEAIRWAVELAGHAPSLYNAQPWSWRLDGDTVELFLDAAQAFPVTDPDNREMSIGCGAALDHLLLGLTAAGYGFDLELGSGALAGGDEDRLARVRANERCEPDPGTLELVEAIPRRHTERRPFSSEPVDGDALDALRAGVDGNGVHLQIVTKSEHRIWLTVLTERAATLQIAQDGYAEELARVTGKRGSSASVPADVVPHVVSPRHSDVTLRDFELIEAGTLGIPESADEHPAWCVLWTDDDTPHDWVHAGQALSRLLLGATARGLATGIQSQPIEVSMIREQINEHLLSEVGHAQVLVRMGWPSPH